MHLTYSCEITPLCSDDGIDEKPKRRGRPLGSKNNPENPFRKKKKGRNFSLPKETMYTKITGSIDLHCRICLERFSQKIQSRPFKHFKSHKKHTDRWQFFLARLSSIYILKLCFGVYRWFFLKTILPCFMRFSTRWQKNLLFYISHFSIMC